jgi:tetratricopeptide (TPR) repeat protein
VGAPEIRARPVAVSFSTVTRLALFLALVTLAWPIAAQDVFVPPVPKGIATEGKVRTPAREIPFPSDDSPWIRVRSERFDILSNTSEDRTRELVADVETLAAALIEASERFLPSRRRATAFIFDRRKDSQPYFDLLFSLDNARASGVYVRYDGGGVMIIDGSRKAGTLQRNDPGIRTAMHELMHDLLRQADSVPPLWLEEGLAEYFSHARVTGERVTAGDPIRPHLDLMRRRKRMSLEELFAVKAESKEGTSPRFYAQSWAAVNWLISRDQKAFFAFMRDVEQGTPPVDALRTHYNKSLPEMEAEIRWRNPVSKQIILRSTAAPRAQRESTPPQPVDRATLLFELGRLLSHVAGAEAEAERHYREALRINPKHARTLAAIGDLEGAVAAAPDDAAVHLLYAETLLTTATGPFAGIFEPNAGDRERFRKARGLAERALALGPENAEGGEGAARGIIGTTYLVEQDLAPGIFQLERARTLAPTRMDFALNLYAMYLRTGDRAKADTLFASTFESSRNKQIAFAARNALLIAETARANSLAAGGKLEEAAAIVRQLAAATPDPNGRREFEQHAAKLEATALINRQIIQYNEAIALANRGQRADAIKLLDELLQGATDESVIADATKLRDGLKRRK